MRLREVASVLLLLLGVAACQAPSGALAGCTVERAAELPIASVQGFMLVPGTLNRHPVMLVVDTGSESSLLTTQAATEFGLEHDGRNRTTIDGVGGRITTANARVSSFGIGRIESLNRSMAVGPMPPIGPLEPPMVGLVGADDLAGFDIDFDMPHRRIALYRMRGCTSAFEPWERVASTVPLRRIQRDLLAFDLLVDGQRVVALLDTGARVSSMRADVAERLGVDDSALARDRATSAHGVDRNTITGHLHQFKEIHIGQEVFRDQHIEVAPLKVHAVDMLLGADYLRTRHVWLSYATHRMFIAPRGL